jgi:DNA-binding NarL/FixJ family response regulator
MESTLAGFGGQHRLREQQLEYVERLRAFRKAVQTFKEARARSRRAVNEPVASSVDRSTPPPAPTACMTRLLTPRQFEIAGLIARGYSNQRIAEALVLTPGTVANHVQHILDRLELRSRTQVAVWYARQAG